MNVPQEQALSKYRDKLRDLASQKGQRNGQLLGLATLGIMAGLPDGRIVADVQEASGTPPLTEGEIKHALATAHRDTQPLTDSPRPRWVPPRPKPAPLGAGAATYVQRMIDIGRGSTLESLAASSPVPIPDGTNLQTLAFLRILYKPDDLIFTSAYKYDLGKVGLTIETRERWEVLYRPHCLTPVELVCCNPLTGRAGVSSDGKPTYRGKACIAEHRYALAEFDHQPLEVQAEFWTGAIKSGTLPVRSITFSGSKSLHALIELGCRDSAAWALETEKLFFALSNPKAPDALQADRNCRNSNRLTRLPGAMRADTSKPQTLLWLSHGKGAQTPYKRPAAAPPHDKGAERGRDAGHAWLRGGGVVDNGRVQARSRD